MKLLPRAEIDRLKQQEKNLEIQEGLKLSRRVDSLRKMASEQEENLDRFRVATLTSVQKEIDSLVKIRDKKQAEVDKLETKLSTMLPEVATERKKLSEQAKNLDKREKTVKEKEEQVDLKEIDIALALKNAENAVIRKESHEKIAEKLHLEAEEAKEQASNRLSSAKQAEKSALKLRKDTEIELELRSKAISEKEKQLLGREAENNQVSRELEAERIRLADMRRTLERELQRIKQNRL